MFGVLKYAVSEILENYDRRTWWLNRAAHRVVGPLQGVLDAGEDGIRVMDRSWDTLIVLDACRADLFEEVVGVSQFDDYDRVYSAGSATPEWTKANFTRQALTDTVYVTGNPVVSRHIPTAFHCFLEPWRNSFDAEAGTVPPEPVTEAAIEAREENPDKRLIVHYLQPHYPFLGAPELRYTEFNNTTEVEVPGAKEGASDVWEAVGLGYEAPDDVWAAYGRNLERVIEAIEPLLETGGKTVITADHGNVIGERMPYIGLPMYGHPTGIHHPALREVPWATIEGSSSSSSERRPEVDVEDQLRSLGYTE